ncbi:MAG: pyridoxamine 5'-phosphate oxidase family protein [Pseudomonadota bacterium]
MKDRETVDPGPPGPEELKRLALDLISGQTTMTLATSGEGRAWAAPVYYALFESSFAFFSGPESRHVQEALESGQASAAIFAQASTWKGIRGLQMSGRVRQVRPGLAGARIVAAYLKKFPFTAQFFPPGAPLDLDGFAARFRVRLYLFEPDRIVYTDNSVKFGFKAEISI